MTARALIVLEYDVATVVDGEAVILIFDHTVRDRDIAGGHIEALVHERG